VSSTIRHWPDTENTVAQSLVGEEGKQANSIVPEACTRCSGDTEEGPVPRDTEEGKSIKPSQSAFIGTTTSL
jgi:hypothetical protein